MSERIVIKIGSSLLAQQGGELSNENLNSYVQAISFLIKSGKEVILVSSGAVAAGFGVLGFAQRPETIAGLQASAAVGQGILMHAYREAFREYGIEVGQVLLTRNDFAHRQSYNNALNVMEMLLEKGVIPIINENDAVVVKQYAFGDNDMLSALVSALVHAQRLCILTDIDGVYDADPRKVSTAKLLNSIPAITEELLGGAEGSGSVVGTGGMRAKLKAAQRALMMGVPVFIGSGKSISGEKLLAIVDEKSESGSYIGTSQNVQLNRKKQWIAFHSETKGNVVVDAGAEVALREKGRSLLPVGIISARGNFIRGDVIEVYSEDNSLIGKGVTEYTYETLLEALGRKTSFAKSNLGVDKVEVIHRDNWVSFQ